MEKQPWLSDREGIWYVNWYEEGNGRPKRKSLETRDAADARAAFGRWLSGSSVVNGRAKDAPTVAQVLDSYEAEHVNVHIIDKRRQKDILHHLRAWFKATPVADIDIPACRAYMVARRSGAVGGGKRRVGADAAKGADSTIRRELGVLSAAVNHARKWKRLNGAEPTIELPPDTPPEETLWLSKDEINRLAQAAEGELKDFIAVAYYTAARRASIETLSVEQIDAANKRINLRKRGEVVTKKRRPIVPIHPKIADTVDRLVLCAGANGRIFTSPEFYYPFRSLCRRAGIPAEKSHPHVLRHSRATHLLQEGVSIYDVAKLLGDTVKTVEMVYGHHSEEFLSHAIGDK